MSRERLDWVDAARGVALTAVVLHHVVQYVTSNGERAAHLLREADVVLDGFRMPTLVALSGMLAAGVSTWPWEQVWRRRVAPLLLIYGIWAVIGTVATAAVTENVSVADAVTRIPLGALRPDGWTWYLAALAIYIALARALRSVPTAPLVVASAAVFLVAVWTWPSHLPGSLDWWWYVAEHWVFFVCAQRWALAYRREAERATTRRALLALAVFAVVGTAAAVFDLVEVPLVLGALALCGTWVSLACAGAWGGALALGWARAIGRHSLGVYVIQSWLALCLWAVIASHVPEFAFDGLVVPLAFATAVLALSYWLTRAIERWAPVPLLKPWWDTSARHEPAVDSRSAAQAQ